MASTGFGTGEIGSPPERLLELIKSWRERGQREQSGIGWRRDAYMDLLPEYVDLFAQLPDRIGRSDVRKHARRAAADEQGAVEAFLVSMAWGYGTNGYGPFRTERILRVNPDAPATLMRVAAVLASDGAVAAYDLLGHAGRLKYLGPAFGTKYLHFVPPSEVGPPALILDQFVSRGAESIGGCTFAPGPWSTPTYARYLETLSSWASTAGVEPADVEMLLFLSQSPGQWAESWLS